jgi:uncharacterized protein
MYQPRTYRSMADTRRFRFFRAVVGESDLWIGVDRASWNPKMEEFCTGQIRQLRKEILDYGSSHPDFFESHIPLFPGENAPPIVEKMCSAAVRAGTGPMAAVAGAFSAMVGEALKKEFGARELLVENGGDIYMDVCHTAEVAVYAGNSPLSGKTGIEIDPLLCPVGICTSSATVGHSFSYGNADAVMIACHDTVLADAWATAWCNRTGQQDDIEPVIESIREHPEILSAIIILGDRMAFHGRMKMRFFN